MSGWFGRVRATRRRLGVRAGALGREGHAVASPAGDRTDVVAVSAKDLQRMVEFALLAAGLHHPGWASQSTSEELDVAIEALTVARDGRRQQWDRIEAGRWPAMSSAGER